MEIFIENRNSNENNSSNKLLNNNNKRNNSSIGLIKTSTPNLKTKSSENSSKIIGGNFQNNSSSKGLNIEWSNEIYRQALQSGDSNKRDPNIHVKLETKQLWQQFASIGTEMIITKCGRLKN